jgi:hypothetical protein
VRLKCWWFHQGIRISNQNKTCKILYNNKKIWYWKLHTKAVETRESVSTYIRLAEERRHIVGNKLNVRCDASYLFPFLSNLFFSFWGRRCILRVIAPTHQPFWATSFESRNMKHSFQKETKETEKFRRAWNKWKTNKFPDRKKQKKTKGVPSVIKSSCECYIYSDLMYTIRRIWIILGNHQIYTNRSYYMLCTYYNSAGSLWRDLKRALIL